MHGQDRLAVPPRLCPNITIALLESKFYHTLLRPWNNPLPRLSLIQSYLRGEVKGPEEKSQNTARHHGNDRERQQPIPLAVVLNIRPEFRRHQTLKKFGHAFHPDLDSVRVPAGPPPPPGGLDRYPENSGVLRRTGAYPTRYEAECSQWKTDQHWFLPHTREQIQSRGRKHWLKDSW